MHSLTEVKTNIYFYDKEKSCELKDYNSFIIKITIDLFESVLQNAQSIIFILEIVVVYIRLLKNLMITFMFKLPKV